MYDVTLNISYIYQLYNDSLLFYHIPPHALRNLWIVAIRYEDTIMADSYSDEILWHQNRSHTKTYLYLTQRMTSSFSNIKEI